MIDYLLMPLNDLLSDEFDERKLISIFEKFSCQRDTEIENFLVNNSIHYEKTGKGRTYLFFDCEKLKNHEISIIAYYTIGHNSIDISSISKKQRRRMLGDYPGRDSVDELPTFLIGQIGRNDNYSHDDLSGETILNECYRSISVAAKMIGGSIVFLECREHMYVKFYEGAGFIKLSQELNDKKLYELYRKVDFKEYWNKNDSQIETNVS